MSAKQLLLALWAQNRAMAQRALGALTDENRHYRLTAEAASAGFLLQHIGEAHYRLLNATAGQPLPEDMVFTTVAGAKDEGQALDLPGISAIHEGAYAAVSGYIDSLTEEQLEEKTETARWGMLSRAEAVGVIMYHNSYHIGQAMLAIKRGKVWS